MSLRLRIAHSVALRRAVAAAFAVWLRLCRRLARWQNEGIDEVRALTAKGPVVLVLWHEHLMMAPAHWHQHIGTPYLSIHDTSPIGMLAGAVQPHFGSEPMAMSAKGSNLATSRAVLKRARAGVTIALTADGPVGPRQDLKDAPIDWARISGLPIVAYAFEMAHARRLGTWDRLRLPMPFGRAACVYVALPDGLEGAASAQAGRPIIQAVLRRAADRAQAIVDRSGD